MASTRKVRVGYKKPRLLFNGARRHYSVRNRQAVFASGGPATGFMSTNIWEGPPEAPWNDSSVSYSEENSRFEMSMFLMVGGLESAGGSGFQILLLGEGGIVEVWRPDLSGLDEVSIASDDEFDPVDISDEYVNFSVDSSGHWELQLNSDNPDIEELPYGETLNIEYPIVTILGTELTAVITIIGTYEEPDEPGNTVITGTDTGYWYTGVGAPPRTVGGQLFANNPDGSNNFVEETVSASGTSYQLTIGQDGNWYILNAAGGTSGPKVYTVRTVDGTTHNITITVQFYT